ncbi:DNA-binding protein YbiB [Niveibacterium sp. SC-1]|uniref:DNA-binding protein YbiB n=1 Tax=Niveibacterium sp. SC-1 TaxID=3135646 RepID=UPI00311F764B
MTITTALAKIGRGPAACEDLTRGEAQELFSALLSREATPVQLGALLMALRWKGETPDELSGFAAALSARTRRMAAPSRAARVAVIPSYSPHNYQPNLIPALAIRLARAGVPVLVHGGLGGGPQGGERPPSFRVFEELGHVAVTSIAQAEETLALKNLAVLPVELLNPDLGALLELRGEFGSRHVGHQLARLLDPFPGQSVRLVCSSDTSMLDRLSDLVAESAGDALLMRATDGETYANPERRPRITWFRRGEAEVLYDEDPYPGHGTPLREDPTDIEAVAGLIKDMLDGRRPTPLPLASQLAACFVATGHAKTLTHARAMVAVGVGVR